MTLKTRLEEEVKIAMRNRNTERLGTLRFILAAIKKIEVDERISVDDTRMMVILSKLVKQYEDSISQYKSAHRADLVEKEEKELKIIQEFLPAPLSPQEIERLIREAITSTGARTPQDMGKVMNIVRPQVQGRADMGIVSNKIKELLNAVGK